MGVQVPHRAYFCGSLQPHGRGHGDKDGGDSVGPEGAVDGVCREFCGQGVADLEGRLCGLDCGAVDDSFRQAGDFLEVAPEAGLNDGVFEDPSRRGLGRLGEGEEEGVFSGVDQASGANEAGDFFGA